MSERGRFDWFTVALVLGCTVLAVLVILLSKQNRELKARISELSTGAAQTLEPGEPLGSLVLVDETGQARALEFGDAGEPTLLLVFSTQCPACEQTFPVWERFLEAGAPGVHVLGVSVDPRSELPATPLPFPIYGVDRDASASMEKMPFIPATVLVGADGTVAWAWFGQLDADRLEELRNAMP